MRNISLAFISLNQSTDTGPKRRLPSISPTRVNVSLSSFSCPCSSHLGEYTGRQFSRDFRVITLLPMNVRSASIRRVKARIAPQPFDGIIASVPREMFPWLICLSSSPFKGALARFKLRRASRVVAVFAIHRSTTPEY
jgi:hypothetical protein